MKNKSSFIKQLALTGLGGLAFITLAQLPTIAAPGITIRGSFAADGSNGQNPLAALTAAGNGLYYGTTFHGGATNNGAIFVFDSATGSINLQGSFDGSNGKNPEAALTAAGNGLYYGTTNQGGANNKGAIFAFNSATGSITLQDSFDGANGKNPEAALTAAGNGIYYGTTTGGGDNILGAIFAFNSATGSITLQGSFDSSTGCYPSAALTPAGNGLYYGTTPECGANNKGAIFAFNSTTGSITLQGSFDDSIGLTNVALTAAGNGLYYGTTTQGGANNKGAIFAFDSTTGSITLQASFDGANGKYPKAALTAAGNGLYYGTTVEGGGSGIGTVFAFDSTTGSITLQASFDSSYSYGSYPDEPVAALTPAENGLYYGTTQFDGPNFTGTIFAFDSGVRDPVPGPLPLMGAAAAFGWSRRLRRRIQQVRPVFPMGR